MATNTAMHTEEVKRVTRELECSPSIDDTDGMSRAPTVDKQGKKAANAKSYTLETDTSEFAMTDRGRTLPNYVREFAREARREGPGRRRGE